MIRHIAAVIFIFACTAVAWAVLGATVFHRTHYADSSLRQQVVSLWGSSHTQVPPTAFYVVARTVKEERTENGEKVVRYVEQRSRRLLPLLSSRTNVTLHLEHRQKGLLWYSTYTVAFTGVHVFQNDSEQDRLVDFTLQFPAADALYDDLVFTLNDVPLDPKVSDNSTTGSALVAAGGEAILEVGYRSYGLDTWTYGFGDHVARVRDFQLTVVTDFEEIDFPDNTLSPTSKARSGEGWELNWAYKNLISGYNIGVTMPERPQPGPLAGRISYFAPVSLFFFFFLMFIITTLRNIELHPMNYFFMAAAFFSFHLLLAYLVDHVSIHSAFAIASLVSITLVVSYLRLVVGIRFAAVEAGIAQLVYLVLFSYAFFLKGFTGLTITVGAILTLFVTMQLTGRIRWADKFQAPVRR